MKKQEAKWRNQSRKVVRLRMDAGFFFERAVRSLDKQNYPKALKYFRLAVEKEPDNPINHCNLAGILSEMGRFEESNEVLETVLNEIDPELHECFFYMANNAANMDDFELAEEYLITYLEKDPDGEFAEEAEEMLQMLAYELGRPPRRPERVDRPEWFVKHDTARKHLEEGRFVLATQLLEELVEAHPDFLAARNNLALAYYYTGQFQQAVDTIHQVLETDPGNLHALCNLAVLYQHLGREPERDRLVDVLKKLVPTHVEHLYKLATTLGILGEHEAAYEAFHRLLLMDSQPEPSLYHYLAAASMNTGRWRKAQKYWSIAAEMDPDSPVPKYYLGLLKESRLERQELPLISYHYQLPFHEQAKSSEDQANPVPEQFRVNPLVRSSFYWALQHGDKETKQQILQLLGWMADEEVEQILRQFLLSPDHEDELKKTALMILYQMGAKGPYHVRMGGAEHVISGEQLAKQASEIQVWRQVLECCFGHMKGCYSEALLQDAQILWTTFLTQKQKELPTVRKVEGWAAALEYVIAKLHGQGRTQTEVAEKYGVSPSTVGRHARQMEQTCALSRHFKEISTRSTE
ncbi:tetratricopeptide repeat protein [Polycladomyces subterraneus]|uniref:Tetratricopeptide repeat protein n=1 Tax=Polycladomyces subterraneus TaxID=1016997 RepID=A0ABT8IP80_9BACL|nr:tetratricopeptide repeat protein [Polycladomyces subterraneus]MDN4594346.1 tetratricopeptide repeat protein [Polycladomyces subterraneus]